MPATKIQDEREALRWFEEGRTYQWMSDTYLSKYRIEMNPSSWANFRRRRGLDARITRDDELIPWQVLPQHRHDWAIGMLRREARRRAGYELPEKSEHELDAWLSGLKEANAVVHYEPDTEQGWFYVPRRKGVDSDIIRKPQRKTKHGT